MDELEISGKRYISTRRAAKQYKYHSDYIGQLIRGKKLLGRKVGRSWYVEFDSLTAYFGADGIVLAQSEDIAVARVADEVAIEITEPEVVVVATQVVHEPAIVAEIIKPEEVKDIEIVESVRDSIHIPIRVHRPSFENERADTYSMLTYVSDTEAYIPMAQGEARPKLATASVMPRTYEEVAELKTQAIKKVFPERNSTWVVSAVGAGALGATVFALIVGGSYFVSSHTVIEEGKAASVGLSLQ